jgi:hypothetical protein
MSVMPLSAKETDRALTAAEHLLEWLGNTPPDRLKTQQYSGALLALQAALRRTIAYQGSLQGGHPRVDLEESRLSDLWFKVAIRLAPLDQDLAHRCEIKGWGWADGAIWEDTRHRDLPQALNRLIQTRFEALRQATLDRDAVLAERRMAGSAVEHHATAVGQVVPAEGRRLGGEVR